MLLSKVTSLCSTFLANLKVLRAMFFRLGSPARTPDGVKIRGSILLLGVLAVDLEGPLLAVSFSADVDCCLSRFGSVASCFSDPFGLSGDAVIHRR